MASPLRAQREALEELWRQGLSGQALLAEQSRLVDVFLTERFVEAAAGLEESVALLALGGYGRRELFPYSDIDLMILYAPEVAGQIGGVAEAILYPLWDAGLDVGHGVRTVTESLDHAREEYFFQVALLDARLLAGSESLCQELLDQFQVSFIEGEREEFVKAMKQFRAARRKRYGSHSYLLEPHIKEGKGGLRDIQAMLWTARVVFGLDGLAEIGRSGILTDDELDVFGFSWNFLVRVRNRLHYLSSRRNDQLYFEQQEEMAEAFGYKAGDGVLRVESFMRDLYGHLQTIAVITDLFFEHVDEVFGLAGRAGGERGRVLEKGIELRNERIHLTALPPELERRPYLLMRLFLASARNGIRIHHRTIRQVGTLLDLVDDKARRSSRFSVPFFEILTEGQDCFAVLEAMLETGLLIAYIPELSRVVCLAQHDLYHVFTVDRHSLQTVAELRRVSEEEATLFQTLTEPRVLFLATLLHDIGKGRGGNHSEIGAEVVVQIGLRMGLSAAECEDMAFVVRYHLFLPENALRRDLGDESFIRRCADLIGSRERLVMLYLLSIADSRATGPSAWSEWKAALLQDLFLKVLAHLDTLQSGVPGLKSVEVHVEQGVEWLRQQVAERLAPGEDWEAIMAGLPADYLLGFTSDEVVEHIHLHREHETLLSQRALVFPRDGESWSLLILGRDQSGLLAKICGVLTLHNLSVLRARIFTWDDGRIVDELQVESLDDAGFSERNWAGVAEDLNLALEHRLGIGHRIYRKLVAAPPRRKFPEGGQEVQVMIDNQASDDQTVIEVHGPDRVGMLYYIAQTLADFGLSIRRALIATEVERLIDVFYVLNSRGQKIRDPDFHQEIKQGLLHTLAQAELRAKMTMLS